jgi:hypothetical protein
MGRFFRVSPTPVQSQFVELPLDFMYGQLQAKQQEYDQAAAMNDQLKGLLDVEVDPRYDLGTLTKKQEEYNAMIDEAARNLERTGDVNSALYGVQDIKRKIAGDPFLKQAPEYWKQIQKDQEDYQKALATGNVPDYYKNYDQYYYSGNKWKGTVDEQGKLQQYSPGQLSQEGKDLQKRAHDMMAGLHASGNKTGYFNLNSDGTIKNVKQGYEGIADTWVKQRATEQVDSFLSTPEGAEFIDMLAYNVQNNPNSNEPLTYEDIKANAAEYLYQAGRNQVFKKTESQQDLDFVPEWARKEQVQAQANEGLTIDLNIQSQPWIKDKVKNLQEYVKNFKFGDDGQFAGMLGKLVTEIQTGQISGKADIATTERIVTEFLDNNPTYKDNFNKVMGNFAATNPEFAKMSDAQKVTTLINGAANLVEKPVVNHLYSEDVQQAVSNRVIGSIDGRELISLEGDGDGKSYTWNDIASKHGIKAKSKEDLIKHLVVNGEAHGIPTKDGSRSMYTVQLFDSKGKVHTYGIQMEDQANAQYSGFEELKTNMFNVNFDYFQSGMEKNKMVDINTYDQNGKLQKNQLVPSIQIDNQGNLHTGGFVASKEDGRTYWYTNDGDKVDVTNKSLKQKQDLVKQGNLMFLNSDELDHELQKSMDNDPFIGTGKKYLYQAPKVEE